MRPAFHRRTATKVKRGRIQKKNRHRPTAHAGYVLSREAPRQGLRHVVTKRDIQWFISLIPEWHTLSRGLDLIMLSRYGLWEDEDGAYEVRPWQPTGAIFLHAWPTDLWQEFGEKYFEAHGAVFRRLGVAHERVKDGVICRFTRPQARAYMLLHIFMHELGHHVERFGTWRGLGIKKKWADEDYAERFANDRFETLYPAYVRLFGDPARADSGSKKHRRGE